MTSTINEREVTLAVPPSDHSPQVNSRNPQDFPVPHGREEEWRFTPRDVFSSLLAGDGEGTGIVEVDAPAGVVVTQVATDSEFAAQLPMPIDRLSALAAARATGITRVEIPQSEVASDAVTVRFEQVYDTDWFNVVIEVAACASARVVIEGPRTGTSAAKIDVLVGAGAQLEIVTTHLGEPDCVHNAHIAFRLGRDSTVRSLQASIGGRGTRVVETVQYLGTGGDAHLAGVFFGESGEHIEHRLLVDHSQPHCRSNVIYKGALDGHTARSVWVGDVIIRAEAAGTQTYEINRNLLLSEGARADSVPNLEIETGNVSGAGHASATGRFDDEQLFYLQARGIDVETARRLVVRGFFDDVLRSLTIESASAQIVSAIESRLTTTDAITEGDNE